MARLDLYPMPGKVQAGYVLDVQAELLSHLATRTVLPLVPVESVPKPIGELNPIFDIQGKRHVLVTQGIATVPRRELKRVVLSLTDHHDVVTRALDTLLIGF